ncbi:MAG: hypothetical protein JF597_00720, partial [Streptomyces sp.]|uniref:hypothetical protein n=1 Tax=Streptomyces sp. TaxID=1931 RepID=UPI0025D4D78A
AVILYALLVPAWVVVAVHSLRHAARHVRRWPEGDRDPRPGVATVLGGTLTTCDDGCAAAGARDPAGDAVR